MKDKLMAEAEAKYISGVQDYLQKLEKLRPELE